MIFETNKDKGRAGIAIAIGYFGSHGYTVSIPLNDTQDYDLVVDNGKLFKISVKATGQRSSHGVSRVNLRNMGGTQGNLYGREKDKDIDYVFVVNEIQEMWLLPKEILNANSINLGKNYKRYKL